MLVTKGFSQVEGLDFAETFAPVARLSHSYPTCICMRVGLSFLLG